MVVPPMPEKTKATVSDIVAAIRHCDEQIKMATAVKPPDMQTIEKMNKNRSKWTSAFQKATDNL